MSMPSYVCNKMKICSRLDCIFLFDDLDPHSTYPFWTKQDSHILRFQLMKAKIGQVKVSPSCLGCDVIHGVAADASHVILFAIASNALIFNFYFVTIRSA